MKTLGFVVFSLWLCHKLDTELVLFITVFFKIKVVIEVIVDSHAAIRSNIERSL